MPPRRPGSAKEGAAPPPAAAAEASEISPSPVRTKFPTARIKRIMQADDEVGKVAQQTPIAVGKALELFMVALVSKSAEVARERSSKRVSAQMLKHVVESDDQWDFLRDIVSKISDEEKPAKGSAAGGTGGKVVKGESESEEEEEVIPEKKKRAGRKKKA
jgi:Dr1-associated corepressor